MAKKNVKKVAKKATVKCYFGHDQYAVVKPGAVAFLAEDDDGKWAIHRYNDNKKTYINFILINYEKVTPLEVLNATGIDVTGIDAKKLFIG